MSIEEQVKLVAQRAANKRWGHPGGPNGMYGDIPITRVEEGRDDTWTAFYIEPDTGTEEDVHVERMGIELHAYAWGQEDPQVWEIVSESL